MPKNLKYAEYLDCYGELLTEKQREVLGYYYNDDFSLAEISENMNISRQGVLDIIHRAQTQLDTFEDKLHLTDLYSDINSAFDILNELFCSENDKERKSKIEAAIRKLGLGIGR